MNLPKRSRRRQQTIISLSFFFVIVHFSESLALQNIAPTPRTKRVNTHSSSHYSATRKTHQFRYEHYFSQRRLRLRSSGGAFVAFAKNNEGYDEWYIDEDNVSDPVASDDARDTNPSEQGDSDDSSNTADA
eukprot:CAMPEP_0183774854 /NCGR_PEP_ID=MMETSP0739-20130205/42969_1 /TAXON_ID=385413 /ORGANISM="Thalassiosira miniscula, Strain CCMP1093" /LENGTH=130 /DNA_ID=CAMNT_0026016287 /DNA_START=124 /DNA_END=513 /DNA_ORIENTATION=+